ncbi:hypothetical protein [Alkaliflexus imshenetskii]|uniref:hypothetical protein n=1 Tax=Alkaliflexus imshenetskii TaxID=286730 RepID=UPI00047BE05E|nr:hypothetical protein [Alkaliflexus imshenetskii]
MNTGNSLDRFIRENREAFDSGSPSDAVWQRIAAQSGATKKQPLILRPVFRRMAAAMVLMLISFSIGKWLFLPNGEFDSYHSEAAVDASKDFRDAAFYYEVQINKRMEKVNELSANYPAIRKGIEMDFSELDTVLQELKDDLNDDVANADVVEAMIMNYRLKLQILEQIMEFLEGQYEDENNENNEVNYSI